MKLIHRNFLLLIATLLFASCDHNVITDTVVHADGSLDKTFTFQGDDSTRNVVSLDSLHGWSTNFQHNKKLDSAKQMKYTRTFSKTFPSAEVANAELAAPSDSSLRITSAFEKRFRWFYTYIRYSETVHAINTLKLQPDDYLVPEDYAFIDRLPAEGQPVSNADKFYLDKLQERLFDVYGARAYLEEYIGLGDTLIRNNGLGQQWIDTLHTHKQNIIEKLEKANDMPDSYLLHVMDSIGIPLDKERVALQFGMLNAAFERKVNFISTASDGQYTYRIHLPWTVVKTNADSVAGNTLIWSPPSIKFLVKDYTMYGECRTFNVWALLVSLIVVAFTGYLFVRKR